MRDSVFSKLVQLTTIGDDQYEAPVAPESAGRLFGGQLIAQGLVTAQATVTDDREVHSLHAYFLRPGDVDSVTLFTVDRVRDGRGFSSRMVSALQNGKETFRLEEVRLSRYDRGRRTVDVWMSFDILSDYGPAHRDMVLDGFAVDPDSLDDDEVTGIALGLPARPIEPDREGWAPRVRVPRAQVDLALEGNGDTRGAAALLVEPLEPTRGLRLLISPVLEITDARWRPDTTGGPRRRKARRWRSRRNRSP